MHAANKTATIMLAANKTAAIMHAANKTAAIMHAANKTAAIMHAANKTAAIVHAAIRQQLSCTLLIRYGCFRIKTCTLQEVSNFRHYSLHYVLHQVAMLSQALQMEHLALSIIYQGVFCAPYIRLNPYLKKEPPPLPPPPPPPKKQPTNKQKHAPNLG